MFASLRDYSNPDSLGSRLRRKRFRHIETLVKQVLSVQDECKILDIGGTARYWNLLSSELLAKCTITILNLEKVRGGDPRKNIPAKGIFKFHCGDGRNLYDVIENQYDISHSNSVIEHVGTIADMQRFSNELVRVGRYYYIQTPNVWFPIEPHYGVPFIHWLPTPLRVWLLTKWNIGFLKRKPSLQAAYRYAEGINLIDCKTLKCLLPDGDTRKEKFLLVTKSIISIGPRAE